MRVNLKAMDGIEAEARAHLRAFPETTAEEWVHYQEGVLDTISVYEAGVDMDSNDYVIQILGKIFDSRKAKGTK